mgnify:CR=1 FL=1
MVPDDTRGPTRLHGEFSERLATAIDAANVGVWDYDPVAQSGVWTPRLLSIFGFSPSKPRVALAEWAQRVHPDDLALAERNVSEALQQGDVYLSEYRIVRPDGAQRTLRSVGAVHRDPQGAVVRAVGITLDVTLERAAQREAEDRARAEVASRAKSELLARVSHEIRAPLNALLGFSQLLSLGPAAAGERERFQINSILEAGRLLLLLANDLLDLSRIEQGRMAVDLTAVAVGPVARASIVLARRATALNPEIEPQVVADGELVLRADAARLQQVLVNLLTNAIKYNRAAGAVTVQVDAAAGLITVADTGPGISPERMSLLFQPFERLGVNRAIEGSGLGLSISAGLVRSMDGTLTATSEPGVGSRFTVRLPRA